MPNGKPADSRPPLDPRIQTGLFIVAGLCGLGAVLHAFMPDRVDEKTALFLGVAAVVLMIREVSKLEFGNWKVELGKLKQEVAQVDQKIDTQVNEVGKKIDDQVIEVEKKIGSRVGEVDRKVNVIETSGLLPGRPAIPRQAARSGLPAAFQPGRRETGITEKAGGPDVAAAGAADEDQEEDEWDTDPNKGKFGGSAQANGRALTATIEPAAGSSSAACDVHFEVRSTDPAKPLSGKVRFFLHPTYGRWAEYDVKVVKGVAADDITAWGAFTLGAVADGGKTKLELDLSEVKGGTDKFYDD